MAPTWAKISAVGEKIKERPMAADEKIGEADILSRYRQLAIVRKRRAQDQLRRRFRYFAFYSPM
jgi:hypothetical protein